MYLGNDSCIELKSVTRISDHFIPRESTSNPRESMGRNIFDFNQNSEQDEYTIEEHHRQRREFKFGLLDTKNCNKQNEILGETLSKSGVRRHSIDCTSVSTISQQFNISQITPVHLSDTSRIRLSGSNRKLTVCGLNQRAATNLAQPIENQNLKRNSVIGRPLKAISHMQMEKNPKDEISHNKKKVIQDLNSLFSSSARLLNYKNRVKINFPKPSYIDRFSFSENYPATPGYFKKCSHVYNSKISNSSFSDEETY